MSELQGVDLVLQCLAERWENWPVWADWFREHRRDDIADRMVRFFRTLPGEHDPTVGRYLVHVLLSECGFGSFAAPGEWDGPGQFYRMYRPAFDNFTITVNLRATIPEWQGMTIRHIGRIHDHEYGGDRVCPCPACWDDYRGYYSDWSSPVDLLARPMPPNVRLRCHKVCNDWHVGRRSGHLLSWRYWGRCERCGVLLLDDPPQPWHVRLTVSYRD